MFALLALTLPGGFRQGTDAVVRLEDLDLSKVRQTMGVAKSRQSSVGNPLAVGGKTYDHGVGMQAEAYCRLRVDGHAKHFRAVIGIDDRAPNFWGTGIQCWLEGDGRVLARTGRIGRRQSRPIEADLTGVKTITLVTAAAGFGVVGDQADWLDAEFVTDGATPHPEPMPVERAVVLTPRPGPAPRLTGPRVFGVRPGNPILFCVTATGEPPITFSATGLPPGVTQDSATGRIAGAVDQPGAYEIAVTAKNDRGAASRPLKLIVGEAIALTPPMGWNSWNSWGWNVTQDQVAGSARVMASTLREHGWAYVNIDDTWQGKRGGPENAIQPNRKFPDIKGLVDQIHGLGLRAGIYSTPWMTSYAGHIGGSADNADGTYPWMAQADQNEQTGQGYRYQHIGKFSFAAQDIRQYADWGFDYLKYDWNPIDIPHTKESFDLLRASGRDIVFSLSNGAPFDRGDGLAAYSQLWRTSGDMSDTWGAIRANAFGLARWAKYQGPGHWNDEDMLVVGRVSLGDQMHASHLTPNEQYLHITQWCLLASPLLIGCDLEHLDPFTLGLLTNDEVLDVDQDPLGVMAHPVRQADGEEVWAKPLEDGSLAVGLFNVSEDARDVKVSWAELGIPGRHLVRDLWRQRNVATSSVEYRARVPRHGAVLIRISAGGP